MNEVAPLWHFKCEWCKYDRDLAKGKKMIEMIQGICGKYRRLVDSNSDHGLTVTPPVVVSYLNQLINPDQDRYCLDLGAGTGELASALPPGAWCIEIDPARCISLTGSSILVFS